jgi:hypothetical protein
VLRAGSMRIFSPVSSVISLRERLAGLMGPPFACPGPLNNESRCGDSVWSVWRSGDSAYRAEQEMLPLLGSITNIPGLVLASQ